MAALLLRVALSALAAALLAARGLRRRSLDASGAAAAFLVGFLTLSAGLRFGAALWESLQAEKGRKALIDPAGWTCRRAAAGLLLLGQPAHARERAGQAAHGRQLQARRPALGRAGRPPHS